MTYIYARFGRAVAYVYDSQHRRTGMRTWRASPPSGQSTTSYGGGDNTTWNYDSQRGSVSSKRDQANKGANYTYTPAGRLKTRAWARDNNGGDPAASSLARLTTTYTYDKGFLEVVSYNDGSTPDVVYSYDDEGQVKQVNQGATQGARHDRWERTYETNNFTLKTEKTTYDLGTGKENLVRTLERYYDLNLRPQSWGLIQGTTLEHGVSYTYDTASRLSTVVSMGDTFTYRYDYNVTGSDHHVVYMDW